MKGKSPCKGKYILKSVNQPLKHLVRRLKDRNVKINYQYNK